MFASLLLRTRQKVEQPRADTCHKRVKLGISFNPIRDELGCFF